MKIILVYGPSLVALENKVSEVKKNFDSLNILELSGKQFDFNQAFPQITTPSLFNEQRLVIMEDFSGINLDKLSQDSDLTLLIRFSKLNSNDKIIKQVRERGGQVFEFSERDEKSIFPFLDMLMDQNPKTLEGLEVLLKNYGSQYVLTMIFYALRRLIIPSKKIAEFAMQKLERQKSKWNIKKINNFYKQVIDTDFKIKSGLLDEKTALYSLVMKFVILAEHF